MNTGTKRRLFLGFLSNWISKLSTTIIQLVGVPIFLHYWSVPVYGEWLVLNAIPSYLNLSNIGFGSVAGNEMSILVAAGDQKGALGAFQSCWMLILSLSVAVGTACSVIVWYLPVDHWLKIRYINPTDAKWIILCLGWSVLLGQLEQLLQSAYRSMGRYPYGSLLKSIISLSAFAVIMIVVLLHGDPRHAAFGFALANILGTALLAVLVKKDIPWIEYGWKYAKFSELRRMFWPALSFMGFPLGNALNLQGTLMAVSFALGPTAVVIFGTARTVSRVALQLVQMVNSTFWPELTLAYGAKDIVLLRKLHRHACQMALVISVSIVSVMMMFGPWFLHRWTGGHVPPSRGLLAIMLLVVIAYSFWATSSTLHAAINKHQKLALYYISGTSITVLLTYVFARMFGLYAAAASLLVSELVMNVYVLPASLIMTGDTWIGFIEGLGHIPHAVRPPALMNHARKYINSLAARVN
ncbi:MAG: lipopolysaccharide biosynthesis protein [Acidobacteriaceae bacterium]